MRFASLHSLSQQFMIVLPIHVIDVILGAYFLGALGVAVMFLIDFAILILLLKRKIGQLGIKVRSVFLLKGVLNLVRRD